MPSSELFTEIEKMGRNAGNFRPHKALLLLAIIDLFDQNILQTKQISYNDVLKAAFTRRFKQFASENDRNRSYAPFFHLKSQSFWSLVPHGGMENLLKKMSTVGGPGQLMGTVSNAVLSDELFQLISSHERRNKLKSFLMNHLSFSGREKIPQLATEEINIMLDKSIPKNPFVSYINSLNSLDGNSDGALAEKQAQEALFCQIHVPHPLVEEIYSILTTQGKNKHVILTGHAGDGKSIIALELYKRLKQLPADLPLDTGLHAKEELNYCGIPITIIKDLSEWSQDEQTQLWQEIKNNQRRFVLVSNTGSLLSLMLNNIDEDQKMLWEDRVLEAMDSSQEKTLEMDNTVFSIYNLALRNNIDLAKTLWQKMVHASGWGKCQQCPLGKACPIYKNISLIQKYDAIILERLGLLLERISDYGSRLTMRQISALFSYMLCSGSNCSQIIELVSAGTRFSENAGDYFFFNHFFGDNANATDYRASQLEAVKIIKAQNFESYMASGVERYFWLNGQKGVISLNIPELDKYYNKVCKEACMETNPNESSSDGAMARRQIRRMFFFLYTPSETERNGFEKFMAAFLNSEMLLQYSEWKRKGELEFGKSSKLKNQLFQVLQEQFCGIRIPDGSKFSDKSLYITLARKQHNIRQSAQVVLGKINFSDNFNLKFNNNVLVLQGKSACKNIDLELTLPFLDYIAHRKNGGISSVLQSSYIDRLEKFKVDILERCRLSNDDGIVLLKQNSKYELCQYRLRMDGCNLEVSND